MHREKLRGAYDVVVLVITLSLYSAMTFWDIRLPGPHYDETFPAAAAVNFYENRSETVPMMIDPSVVTLFGRPLPLMLMTYIGSVQTFLYIPVFMVLGDDVAVVRGTSIVLGCLFLFITYLFFRNAFDRTIATATLVLLCADPGFVFYTTRDFGPSAVALLLKMT